MTSLTLRGRLLRSGDALITRARLHREGALALYSGSAWSHEAKKREEMRRHGDGGSDEGVGCLSGHVGDVSRRGACVFVMKALSGKVSIGVASLAGLDAGLGVPSAASVA